MAATTREPSHEPTTRHEKRGADKYIAFFFLLLQYSDHIAELSNAKPKQPFFFLKPPSSMLLPGEGPCVRPKGVDMHFEVELALVMGKTVRDLKPDDLTGALEAIKGMTSSPRVPPFHKADVYPIVVNPSANVNLALSAPPDSVRHRH